MSSVEKGHKKTSEEICCDCDQNILLFGSLFPFQNVFDSTLSRKKRPLFSFENYHENYHEIYDENHDNDCPVPLKASTPTGRSMKTQPTQLRKQEMERIFSEINSPTHIH